MFIKVWFCLRDSGNKTTFYNVGLKNKYIYIFVLSSNKSIIIINDDSEKRLQRQPQEGSNARQRCQLLKFKSWIRKEHKTTTDMTLVPINLPKSKVKDYQCYRAMDARIPLDKTGRQSRTSIFTYAPRNTRKRASAVFTTIFNGFRSSSIVTNRVSVAWTSCEFNLTVDKRVTQQHRGSAESKDKTNQTHVRAIGSRGRRRGGGGATAPTPVLIDRCVFS